MPPLPTARPACISRMRRTIRITSDCYTDRFIEDSFHHEFAHLLQRSYREQWEPKAWIDCNPRAFSYREESGVEAVRSGKDSEEPTDEWNRQGFLCEYGASDAAEDFATIAADLLIGDDDFWKRADKFPALKAKINVAIGFYAKLERPIQRSLLSVAAPWNRVRSAPDACRDPDCKRFTLPSRRLPQPQRHPRPRLPARPTPPPSRDRSHRAYVAPRRAARHAPAVARTALSSLAPSARRDSIASTSGFDGRYLRRRLCLPRSWFPSPCAASARSGRRPFRGCRTYMRSTSERMFTVMGATPASGFSASMPPTRSP